MLQCLYQIIQVPNDPVEELVHKFRLLHFGDVDENLPPGAGHPAGLGVGAAAAGKDENAGVGPFQGFQVGGELAFRQGVMQTLGILFECPFRGFRVDVGPMETRPAVRRIAEVIHFVTGLAEALHHVGEVRIPPAGGNIDSSHTAKIHFFPIFVPVNAKLLRYHLVALAVVAVWGVTFVCTKVLIQAGLHPVAIFFARFLLAYAGIWIYLFFAKEDKRLWYGWKEEAIFLLLGVTGGSLYFLTENLALAYTQATNVSFLVCSAPLFTAIFTLIYKRFGTKRFADGLENIRVGWPLVGGTMLALAGMAMLVFDGSQVRLSPKGDLLAIAAALCWAAYSLYMAQMTREYGPVTATRKVFFYGLITILPFLGRHTGSLSPAILGHWNVLAILLFLGLIASLVCFILWNLAMEKLGNVTSTNYVYLNPIFTLLTAMAFLGERMTLLAGIGCAAILGGVIWAGYRR